MNKEFAIENYSFDAVKSSENMKLNRSGFKVTDLQGTILNKRPFFTGNDYIVEVKILQSSDINSICIGLSRPLQNYSQNFLECGGFGVQNL